MPPVDLADAARATRIDVVDCAKTYPGGGRALAPTRLQVEPGEVLALLGPSGCGKTTLLRLIAGLVAPDHGGRVRFNGEDVTGVPIERRHVGMLFQHYALFPQMTVEQNIGYGLRIRGVPTADIRRRVGELMDLVRLEGLGQRRPSALSGGQKQRVALARAVAVQPRVLLLDEPMAALDAKLKEALREELAALLRSLRITTVHVTHDQQEAMAIADRMAVMHGGEIVQVGEPETLYRRPSHPFVAAFLGRVNRLRRSDGDRAAGLVRIAGVALRCPDPLAAQDTLLLRPEDVVPERPAADLLAGGASQARVTRRVFLGERLHLHLDTPDQGTLVCDVDKDSPFKPGDAVALRVAPTALMPAMA